MLEFKINNYLTLKLEANKTNIYVNGNLFLQCKYLLIHIPHSEISSYDHAETIDEAIEDYNSQAGSYSTANYITPEVEFWGHCSNIQTWYENNYDTRLLHTNLSFPLLKKLADSGDPKAKHALKEEIISRLSSHHLPVIIYLVNENYLRYLTHEELEIFAWDILNKVSPSNHVPLPLLKILVDKGISKASQVIKQEIIDFLSSDNLAEISYILDNNYHWYLTRDELTNFINDILEKEKPLPIFPILLNRKIITQISKKHHQFILEHFPHIKHDGEIFFLEIDIIDFWDTDTLNNSVAHQWLSDFEDFDGDNFDLIFQTLNAVIEYDFTHSYNKKVIIVSDDQRLIEHERLIVMFGEALAAAEIVAAFIGSAHEGLSEEILDWIYENRHFLSEKFIEKAKEVVSTIHEYDISNIFSDLEENEDWLENLEDLLYRLK